MTKKLMEGFKPSQTVEFTKGFKPATGQPGHVTGGYKPSSPGDGPKAPAAPGPTTGENKPKNP